jgi:NAD(P)-dependent dehydrogenase (short-subunit alcohol dehydrogenase family)
MVKYNQILSSNAAFFATPAAQNLTAVFVGSTSGIGLGALRAFAKHTANAKPTIYVVGRSHKALSELNASISKLNPTANFIPVQADDLTVIKNAQAVAETIRTQADKIDYLVMTAGFLSVKYEDNTEGLDRAQAIRYYARMRILLTLRPLLLKSPAPRVVSVLAAGTEGPLYPEDWTLKDHYSLANAAKASGSMMTLFYEEFSKQPENDKISIVYTYPGIVGGTEVKIKGLPGWVEFLVNLVARPVMRLIGQTVEESGERVMYAATNPQFKSRGEGGKQAAIGSDGSQGSGVYLLHNDSEVIPGNEALTDLRKKEMEKGVWDHTMEVFERVEKA